jgi:hypothetical protein
VTSPALTRTLEATGYLDNGRPAPGVLVDGEARASRRGRRFAPDALWRGRSALTVYFKYEDHLPSSEQIAAWRCEIWNEGFVPLLWLISPKQIDLYNGFARPIATGDAEKHRLGTFEAIEQGLRALDELAGRLSMETGQFWLQSNAVDRKTSVDQQLLSTLAALERDLVTAHLDPPTAQGLIGRSIFTQYLIDRRILDEKRLRRHCGVGTFPDALRAPLAARALFRWLAEVFNGDMFPPSESAQRVRPDHLSRVADFLEAVEPETGQRSFFPYQFDIIPVELISSIYEQFAHSNADAPPPKEHTRSPHLSQAKRLGVHYTRLPVVSLVLDEVMDGLTGSETILDLTCGSGVFLVEALRRLVALKAGVKPPRHVVRSTLYNQIYGVDISAAAIRVAAFSLYLAALELDPNPHPPEALTFKSLIGRTLIVGNARDVETTPAGAPLRTRNGDSRPFDIIVGNPPWTFKGRRGTMDRRRQIGSAAPMQPRGEGLDFVLRATDFGHARTRYGFVLSAMPFFAGSKTGTAAARHVINRLSPATIVNLASLSQWLFPTAKMPAVVLLARCRATPSDQLTVVNVPWSPSAERSHTFEIAPTDIVTLPLASWGENPQRLKTAAFGRARDILLLDDLRSRYQELGSWLASIGSE